MKKFLFATALLSTSVFFCGATNIEEIYGKNDLDLSVNRGIIYSSNFGGILDYEPGEPVYVDVRNTEIEIERLNSEIDSYKSDIENFRSKIAGESSGREEIGKLISKIDQLLVDLRSTSAMLYATKTDLNDKEMRQKVQKSVEENRQQIYDLTNRREDLEKKLKALSESIDVSNRYITVNTLFIRKDTRMIEYLKECISFSHKDTTSVEALMSKSTSYQSDVDDILNVSF